MGNLGKIDNYRTLVSNGDLVSLPAPLDTALYTWSRIRDGSQLPIWRDWDWLAVPVNAIPWCTVVDHIPFPQDFKYRFWGTTRTLIQGYDATGDSVLDLAPVSVASKVFREYSEVAAKQRPLLFETYGMGLHESKSYRCLRLPFGNGVEVTQILSIVSYAPTDVESICDYFQDEAHRTPVGS